LLVGRCVVNPNLLGGKLRAFAFGAAHDGWLCFLDPQARYRI
jgi:hypothetical protein